MKAGVLALQGAFREHREVLDALGVDAVEVRTPAGLAGLDALGDPGRGVHDHAAPARHVGSA